MFGLPRLGLIMAFLPPVKIGVEPDYGKDIFVHQGALLDIRWLKEGSRVEFKVVQGEKGLQAEDVIVLNEGEKKGRT